MTAQIPDTFLLDGKKYALVGRRGSGLFEPAEHGIPTFMMHTGCWRGYIATYSITDALRLDEVELQMAEPDPERTLFGARPASYDRGRATYRGLEQIVEYSGGILLGDGFVRELYVHMGFHPPHKWLVVHELIFERGRVVERHDRSAAMAKVRERLAGNPLAPGSEASDAEIREWIAGTFSLEY
jgi:hypothetical protein